ncbi:hypothetical protein BaRGS_00006831 [Batillaria attramentaria]|uniref:Uncharacterized protein n=1 Tax=Batillaria attramentaria TaxID=370345 RepID=A0ABD0LR88_9CAEN
MGRHTSQEDTSRPVAVHPQTLAGDVGGQLESMMRPTYHKSLATLANTPPPTSPIVPAQARVSSGWTCCWAAAEVILISLGEDIIYIACNPENKDW